MDPKDVDVVILCGGLGTRLHPMKLNCPKPMAPVGEKPFLDILVHSIAEQGFKRFILCTGYKGAMIQKHFKTELDLTILFSQEDAPLGTAGALKNCQNLTHSENMIVFNGDSFCPMQYGPILQYHAEHKALATVAVIETKIRPDAGFVKLDKHHHVKAFNEKKPISAGYLNTGVYVFNHVIFNDIPEGVYTSLEKEVFPSLPADKFFAYVTSGVLYDIGTPERLENFRTAYSRHAI